MRRYDTVLFDFDGTIFDTFTGIATCMRNTLVEEFGWEEKPLEFFRPCAGPPLTEAFQLLGIPDEDIPRGCAAYRSRYKEYGIYQCELYDGILDTLHRLKNAGVRLGIASSKADYIITAILGDRKMSDLFSTVSATPFTEKHITKQELIETAMTSLGESDRSRTVMCGDRFYDAEGAEQAGVDFIAAAYGFAPEGELQQYPYVFWADNAAGIADYILGA